VTGVVTEGSKSSLHFSVCTVQLMMNYFAEPASHSLNVFFTIISSTGTPQYHHKGVFIVAITLSNCQLMTNDYIHSKTTAHFPNFRSNKQIFKT